METATGMAGAGHWSKRVSAASIDGILPRMVEPEVLMPAQFFDRFRGSLLLEGERRLMLAVLEDAVSCFQKNVGASQPRQQRIFAEADEWFADADGSWPFSFESVCVVLGYDADYFRGRLMRWKDEVLGRDIASRARVGRIRLRSARRHKIRESVPRKRNKRNKKTALEPAVA